MINILLAIYILNIFLINILYVICYIPSYLMINW